MNFETQKETKLKRIIRIVHLEDDENDAYLVKEAINSEITNCTIHRVATKEEFIDAISNEQCDLIISDFALPTFDGIEALKIAQKLVPRVPYIYVSGHIGEDRAIEALKNGATDYVLKDKQSKLVPAILRALKEVEENEKRKLLEEAVKESERFAKSTLDAMTVPVAVLDGDGFLLVTNKAWKMNQYPDASVPQGLNEGENYIQECFKDSANNSTASEFATGIQSVFQNLEKIYIQEYSFVSSGEKKWFRSIVDKFKEAGPLRVIILHIDITESKSANERLKVSEKRYRLLAENSSDMISTHDKNWKFQYVSPASFQLFGYQPDELLYNAITEFIHPEDKCKILEISSSILEEGNVHSITFRTRKKDGTYIWTEMTAKRILNDFTGEAESIIAVSRDISERKNYELELKTAKEKAEEMNRLKSNFLANMSHELRTPLIGILGFADLLKCELVASESIEMAETIFKSGNRLLETLNLILDLASIEANKMKMKFKIFDCVAKVKEIVKLFTKAANTKNLYLKVESDIDALEINLDERMFTAIFESLINNAIKFTDEGGVTITISTYNREGIPSVKIKVIDSGIGIPEESKSLIFDEFRQVSEGYGRGFEGTGLGLTITKNFIKKLNGEIELESELSKGTTFSVSFYINQNNQTGASEQSDGIGNENNEQVNSTEDLVKTQRRLPSILLVEDDETTRSVTGIFLKNYFIIETASDALSAIKMAKEKKYSAILMDINLGIGMNGVEAAREIKKLPGYKDISIIAFTAFAMEKDKEEFLNACCSHYLSKPFTKQELLDVVRAATADKT